MAAKANGRRASSTLPRKLVVSIRMMDSEQQALAEAAAARGVSVACLTRVLTAFGLTQLAKGNRELERAVKTSRDA
jgi:hypothetical protein